MTPGPVAVTGEWGLDEAQALMDEHRIRHLPVLEEGRLVGVLSERDLLAATGWLPARVHACRGGTLADEVPRRVRDIAHQPAVAVAPEDSLAHAVLQLLQHRIGCLPVVSGGTLVGIVSEMDLLHVCIARTLGPAAGEPETRVAQHMAPAPLTIHWYTSLGAAIDLCRAEGVRHLPVLEAGNLVGLVSDRDLRRAVGSGRPREMPVDEVVTRELVTIRCDEPLSRAAEIMSARRFSSLPVVDGGELVGILTLTDILEQVLALARTRLVHLPL